MRNNKPLISICCITYNHEKYISDAIEGFLMQKTDFPIEIIIHDDASTDNTQAIIKRYAERDNRINPILRKQNLKSKGVAIFPITYKMAKGKYIALCEGDDYWTDPLKLQKQVDFLEENEEYGMVHTEFSTLYQKTGYVLPETHKILNIKLDGDCSKQYWNLFGIARATIKTPTVCVRKYWINRWTEELNHQKSNFVIGDFPLFFYVSINSRIGYLKESTTMYRTVFAGSASNAGNDFLKIQNIRKTIVDIRLYFLNTYQLKGTGFKKAILRDIKYLFNVCIITKDKEMISLYLDKLNKYTNNHLFIIFYKIYLYIPYLFLPPFSFCAKIKFKFQSIFYVLRNKDLLIYTISRKINIYAKN